MHEQGQNSKPNLEHDPPTGKPQSVCRRSASRDQGTQTRRLRPSESRSSPPRRQVSTLKIPRHYVVDTNVAVLGSLPDDLIPNTSRALATAAAVFMSRAAIHGAELHVPELFFSEVANVIYRDAISTNLITLEDGLRLLQSILAAKWQNHTPDWGRVYAFQKALQRTRSTGDAEFLAVAESLGYEFITADESLERSAKQHGLNVPVILVSSHPWAQAGALDDYPPTE